MSATRHVLSQVCSSSKPDGLVHLATALKNDTTFFFGVFKIPEQHGSGLLLSMLWKSEAMIFRLWDSYKSLKASQTAGLT